MGINLKIDFLELEEVRNKKPINYADNKTGPKFYYFELQSIKYF